jgi:hypothetical protein
LKTKKKHSHHSNFHFNFSSTQEQLVKWMQRRLDPYIVPGAEVDHETIAKQLLKDLEEEEPVDADFKLVRYWHVAVGAVGKQS